MAEEERVVIEREADGAVAVVRLNRPGKHNALDRPMIDGIAAAIQEVSGLASRGEIRAVVLEGAGPSFCSGLDVAAVLGGGDFAGATAALLERGHGELANLVQSICFGWRQVAVPVIAAIDGNCLGGGLQIALGADVRIAAPGAKLAVAEVRWGLIPDMAITTALPRLVGIDHAKELTFTGRTVSGDEAAGLGLVTRTADDPGAEARRLAGEIAERSPAAVSRAKRLFDEAWDLADGERLALEEQLQKEILEQLAAAAQG